MKKKKKPQKTRRIGTKESEILRLYNENQEDEILRT